jgi:phosphatidylinositol alpha 1,6-mannosyltransferase
VVASFHTHFVSYFRFYGIGRFESAGWSLLRRFYRRCSRIYVPSHSIIRELHEQGMKNLELWSRGIDLSGFSPAHRDRSHLKKQYGIEPHEPVLLLVSRLVKEKDLTDLIDVDHHLRQRRVDYRFVLVGDGPLRPTLERALPHAIFAGHQAGPELARWYASSDVFVFPSTTETLGNVVLEALASETPAVVVDRGGPQDLIRHGETGFVARANDTGDISRYLQLLLEDEGLRGRLGRAGRESASSRDWEEINGGLIDSYARVIAGTTSGAGVG